MNIRDIKSLNSYFLQIQSEGKDYESKIGKGTSLIGKYSNILLQKIPHILSLLFPVSKYKIKASVGTGRITRCPWIVIMDRAETTTPQSGVYLVFLFSQNLSKIYLTLAQGVTDSAMEDIITTKNRLKSTLHHSNLILAAKAAMQISNEDYNESAIFANEWHCNNSDECLHLLQDYKKIYSEYIDTKSGCSSVNEYLEDFTPSSHTSFSIKTIIQNISNTGLLYDPLLVKRFAFSLLSKHFLILSGLAGSGKTQLALAFAEALIESESQKCVVSVGADWTNKEPLLGFPNALQEGSYVKPESKVLDLLMEANKPENHDKPYFLILDEMNMSYVERYFADFLSSMESNEPIALWTGAPESDVPEKIKLPANLFIIGTINVDETTYMFSPKVLDRANVIEFKISEDNMEDFLKHMKPVHRENIFSQAAAMGASFVKLANDKDFANTDAAINQTLQHFFSILKSINAEFGYRSATEIFRFIQQATVNDDTENKMTEDERVDAAIVQKLLPKLHGSRKKLEPVLMTLWKECFDTSAEREVLSISKENVDKAKLPLTADKIQRMYESAYTNGFTSFAEA